jgi:hypothetical protein
MRVPIERLNLILNRNSGTGLTGKRTPSPEMPPVTSAPVPVQKTSHD